MSDGWCFETAIPESVYLEAAETVRAIELCILCYVNPN